MSDHEAPPADPDELDFTDDESVVETGESRYVVGTNGRPNVRRSQPDRRPADETGFTSADPSNPAERRPPDPGGGSGAQRLEVAETLTRPAMQAVRRRAATALPRSTASR